MYLASLSRAARGSWDEPKMITYGGAATPEHIASHDRHMCLKLRICTFGLETLDFFEASAEDGEAGYMPLRAITRHCARSSNVS